MTKTKISITLSEGMVEHIDREVRRRPGGSRSAVIEEWLRRAARARAADVLREETVAYYDGLSPADVAEDDAISHSGAEAARRLRYDE